jgi:WD40 repeat protein
MVYSLADGATHWRYESNGSSHWWRAMDWHPNSKWLAFGQEKNGQICILDIETKQVIQERVLSVRASKPDNMAVLKSLGRDLEVTGVKFVDSGRKLAIWTSGDGSIELYDLVDGLKWRFARGGTEDGPGGAEWRDENGKVTSGYGHGMVVWNDEKTGAVRLASIDCDGVRIWSVRLGPNM